MKKGQTWSIEAYIAVSVMLLALIMFYAMIGIQSTDDSVQSNAEAAAAAMGGLESLEDGELDNTELLSLESAYSGLNGCEQLKQDLGLSGTDKKVCIYLTDESGAIQNFVLEKAIGCEGLEIAPGIICG
jgi:hypothetical protein